MSPCLALISKTFKREKACKAELLLSLDICPWVYFRGPENTWMNTSRWEHSEAGLSNDEPSQVPYSLHIYWTNTTKIAKIRWVLVLSASVKITLLQKPAFSAVHNCNSTEMPQMQNTVFLLYLHSWYTYSNKGGREGMHEQLRPMGEWEENEEMQRMRRRCSTVRSRRAQNSACPAKGRAERRLYKN